MKKQKEYKYHYTYRITNIVEKKYYYGVHSCNCLPKEDIGVKYFSSSKNVAFKADIKENPQNYKYKVVKVFSTRLEALAHEVFLHNKFNVGVNKKFYNGSKQGSTNRDTSGMFPARDVNGTIYMITRDDERFISGELIANSKRPRKPFTQEHKGNLSIALTGKPKSKEHIAKSLKTRMESGCMRGDRHHNFKGYYVTPLGTFDSPAALMPIISLSQMKIYCNFPNRIISKTAYNKSEYFKSLYTYDEIKDRTYGDLGFSRELKNPEELKEQN